MPYRTISFTLPVNRVAQLESEGCAIASAAMEINFLKGTNYSYWDMKSMNNNSILMNWGAVASRPDVNLNYARVPSSVESSFSNLRTELFNKIYWGDGKGQVPVIVRVENPSTGGMHYVVVNGFQGTIEYIGVDPDNINFNSITTSMFRIIDPGYTDHYTLADVVAHYGTNADLKALYEYTR